MTGKGYVVKTMTVKIGSVQYECEVKGLTETENHDTQTALMACPGGAMTDVGPSSFSLDIDANAVLDPSSLYVLLTTPSNYGIAAHVEYAPDATSHPTFMRQADVVLVPVGAAFVPGQWAEFSVSLPCTAPPTWKVPPTLLDAQAAEPEPAAV